MFDKGPCAMWTGDCQGKQDYDGRLLSISTRYWPGPGEGGAMTFSREEGFGTAPYGPCPSAHSAILLNYGQPWEPDGYGHYVTICEAKFEADTEAGVKSLVEAWVAARFAELIGLLGVVIPDEPYGKEAARPATLSMTSHYVKEGGEE